MNTRISLLALAALVAVAMFATSFAAAAETILYVSLQGNDQWTGKLESPNDAKTDGPLASLVGTAMPCDG